MIFILKMIHYFWLIFLKTLKKCVRKMFTIIYHLDNEKRLSGLRLA